MTVHFVKYSAVGALCFALGYAAAYFNADSTGLSVPNKPSMNSSPLDGNPVSGLAIDSMQSMPSAEAQRQFKSQYQQVQSLIQHASEQQLAQYLQQAFPDYAFDQIRNKQQFAQQMLNEFVQAKNDPQQQLIGQAYVTAQSQLNPADVLPREIYAKQPLYAHFDTFGKVPPNAQVMVRWTQRDTGEILLFTPRKVSENQQNWVSFYPVLGWNPGHYDVKYYQMNDQMEPIAQTSFYIQQVLPQN
ncbi:hypothetical protein KXJ74_16375 [Acinetobacter johnsonii]|nr:hypothetical protein KXJ74_16375 [Acinetobacter johnsonii]